ncbi:hypothetical protein D1646_01600 [Pseudoflavonifractor sp. 60]|uniref:hypothetical protein n=1 Tax=Pseudoflavonifractor sp. 60 TaxID=2304576 RepID=UPI00136C6E23|nr:hypothetical protein [Pseudoflavonifractor sp. 60]NBI65519.1 hypothetical protein [Pseudoflavonifractor sp. 60]
MIIYSVLMFAAAVLFVVLAAVIYKGNTSLIHAYHQTHVSEADRSAYGKSFSKGLFVLAASLILSGIVALLGESPSVATAAVSVLFLGMAISFAVIARVQKKYNGGF